MLLNVIRSHETRTFVFENSLTRRNAESFLVTYPVTGGVFGVEYHITKDKTQVQYFMHSLLKTNLAIKDSVQILISTLDKKDMSCYSLSNNKSSCFPFQMNFIESIWDYVHRYVEKQMKDEQIIVQLILNKKKNLRWQTDLAEQYQDYIAGIELPTSNKLVRSIQLKILEFIMTKDIWTGKNQEIIDAENKYAEIGFDVSLRFAIYGRDKNNREQLAKKIKLAFSSLNYANSWIMSRIIKVEKFLDKIQLRKTSLFNNNTMCVSELLPFFLPIIDQMVVLDAEIPYEDIEIINEHEPKINKILSMLPTEEKKNKKDDLRVSQKISQVFKKLGLIKTDGIIVRNIKQGATTQRITFDLPDGLKLTDITNMKRNIQAELAIEDIGIEQGSEAGTASLTIPLDERETVYLHDCLKSPKIQEYIKTAELPIILGVDNNSGEIVTTCLTKVKHLLIAGTTGSGKSVCLNAILLTMLLYKNPKSVQFLMIDPKMVELSGFKNYPNVLEVITDMSRAEMALEEVVVKMDKRYELFQKNSYRNIQQYNRNEKEKMPYLVIVIDELADLIMTHKDVEDSIVRLAQKARAAGIHLIIGTQRPDKNVLTGLIKSNISSRICFLCSEGINYRIALDETPPYNLLGKGDGIYKFEGKQGIHRFQGAAISIDEDDQSDIIEHFASHWGGGYKKENFEIKERKKETDLEKLKKIIAESGETRINELQKLIGLRQTRIKELYVELVNEGWLAAPKSRSKGYELLLTEEEMKRKLSNIK